MANTHEHLEHAEHAGHHAADPFNQRVAVSVAVVAALLAGISMLGHRKHNEVLQLQGEANRLTSEGSILHTKATDKWGEYQAVNIRDHGYQWAGGVFGELAKGDGKLAAGLAPYLKTAKDQNEKYGPRLDGLKAEATALGKKGDAKIADSLGKMDDSHHAHAQANRLDFAHLGAEIGIVLCSLALLTKRKAFWFAGLFAAVAALALVVSAYTLSHHPHEHPHAHDAKGDGH